jgi:hypothetical protein
MIHSMLSKSKIKNPICFYWRTMSGLSGWLNVEDVIYLMDYVLTYDKIEVENKPDMEKEGSIWYGLRLQATREATPDKIILVDGEPIIEKKKCFKYADTFYYFNAKETRDSVLQYWQTNG